MLNEVGKKGKMETSTYTRPSKIFVTEKNSSQQPTAYLRQQNNIYSRLFHRNPLQGNKTKGQHIF